MLTGSVVKIVSTANYIDNYSTGLKKVNRKSEKKATKNWKCFCYLFQKLNNTKSSDPTGEEKKMVNAGREFSGETGLGNKNE